MTLVQSLRSFFGRPAATRTAKYPSRPCSCYRPTLEGLEDRLVLSAASALAPPALAPALAAPATQLASLIPLRIANVVVQDGQLIAQGVLGSTTFTAPITLTADPASQADCPILHLRIDAIHLNLLGLTVDTSNICLEIDADAGPGNLLGNLLCNVSHALAGGTGLGDILGGLSTDQLGTVTGGLTGLLNGVLGRLTSPLAVTGVTGNILHLSVGPVELNLLGLQVSLDNCDDGPVTVDIGAQPGPGQLLGNLLSGLTHLLDSSANDHAILNKLSKIAHEVEKLI